MRLTDRRILIPLLIVTGSLAIVAVVYRMRTPAHARLLPASAAIPVELDRESPQASLASQDDRDGQNSAAAQLSEWLTRKGNEDLLSDRLQQAVWRWELALALTPDARRPLIKLQKARKQLARLIDYEYEQGRYSFKYMHYDKAIAHWERVMCLVKDKSHPRYKDAMGGIEKVREQLRRRL